MSYKAISQEEDLGCGVACIASLLNINYKKAIKIFGKRYNKFKGTYCNDIKHILNKKGLNYQYGKATPKTKKYLEVSGTIVFIKRSKEYPVGHFLLKTQKGFMDPWINYPSINPAKAGFQRKLPGKPQWIICEVEQPKT
jgi:hypothetical protein